MNVSKLKNIIILLFILLVSIPGIVFATNESKELNIIGISEYTEEYKKWLELPDDEKKNYIMPKIYKSVNENKVQIKSNSNNENIVAANSLPTKYKNPYYGNVRDQGDKSICWAYSTTTAFESNYFYTTSIKNEFSPLHMDYVTSRQYNPNGFYRNADEGGNFDIALAYATNGMGVVPSSSIGNKTPSNIAKIKATQKVNDFIELNGMAQIKNYIYKYGVVPVYTYFVPQFFSTAYLYNNDNLAYCCDVEDVRKANHAVTLVGWDDNYKNDSFPNLKGAYIALNSHGSNFGNNGLYYIFYDDVFVNETLYGVMNTGDINYDYIYQYDEYGHVAELYFSDDTYAANVFKRQSSQANEKLTEISFYLPTKQSVKCYINANGKDVSISNATNSFTTEVLDIGYHTIKLKEPVILNGNEFSVVIRYSTVVPMERNVNDTDCWYYTVTSNNGESYLSADGYNYVDFQDVVKQKYKDISYSNACIKAFTQKINETPKNNSNTNETNNSKNVINYNENKSDLESYLFDYKYYADHNLDLYNAFGYNQSALRNHWNIYGQKEGRQASAVFDAKYYVSNNSDLSILKNNYVEAYNHFVKYGFAEYRKSSLEYDGSYYKSHNGDLANMSSMELIRHYVKYGKSELRRANINYDIVGYLFDANIYAKYNQDVVKVFGKDYNRLKMHWSTYGIAEGRIASLIFDAKNYLNLNSDVAKVYGVKNYLKAYEHFVNYGFAEGRQGNLIFSTQYYLTNNADLKKVFGDNYLLALNHFIIYGKNEFRKTSAKFNVSQYRAKNIDLNKAFGNTAFLYFEHYIMFGQNEKRTCL